MDLDSQMEAQGYDWLPPHHLKSRELTLHSLPTKFDSTSDPTDQSHVASNVAASLANAETATTPALELKPTQASVMAESLQPQAETSQLIDPSPAPNGVTHVSDLPIQNGLFSDSVTLNKEPILPDSQPIVDMPAPLQSEPAITTSASSFEESFIPSSIPADAPSTLPTAESTQPTMESISEPIADPQPPTSDLRTSPHADELTPGEVAMVEEQKHEEDNAAAEAVVDSTSAPVESVIVSPAPASTVVAETSKVGATGLATPPPHSPPPTPQPAPAELPENPPLVPATEVPEPPVVPLEQPVEPVPTPAEPDSATEDQLMTDVASPPTKVAREREEDQDDAEPPAKRAKTEEEQRPGDSAEFKVPEAPATTSTPDATMSTPPAALAPADGDDSVTQPRVAHMKKVISNLKKSNASQAFRLPVDPVALNIPTYTEIVKEPMDLGTIDNKLKQGSYTSVADFVREFELIVGNCVKFNGRDHLVTQAAFKMQSSFNNQMSHLPKAGFAEPSKEEKRAAKAKQEPTRQAPPRRLSTVEPVAPPPPTGSARSPAASSSTQAFAPGPDGVPLIRRDSNMADGRPKRQIVPTKRNQEYQGGRPKKKKYELQLKFCDEVLKEIMNPRLWAMNQYFTYPVDPVALNIPTYFTIIKKPMDLGTVQTKLQNNVYEKAKDFEEDVHLVFKNCYKFNPEGDHVNQSGHQLEELFDKKWATKDDWIAAREPASEPQSDEEEDDEDEESEDDGDDSETERNVKIERLQKAIAEMSKQMGELTQPKSKKKKSRSPNNQPKKSKSKSGKKDKPRASFPGLAPKHEKKKSVSKPAAKERYVTFAEKQYISNGIAMLPEKQMQEALRIIQQSVPSLANSDQNEIELDIEEVPNFALIKLLQFVKKYAGPPPDEAKTEADSFSAPSASKSKKNKPMSKHDQEKEIDELQSKLGAYARGHSPSALPSVEKGDSSDDDGDSSESEEE